MTARETTMQRNMLFTRLGAGGVFLTLALAGCSPGPIADGIPASMGGLPANTPQRTSAPPPYPAVHNVPQARGNQTMSVEEQMKLERELSAARKQQEALQDPNIKKRGEAANATAASAAERAKAEAKRKPSPSNTQ